jgi:F-type H+-transporting ATPase subunit b
MSTTKRTARSCFLALLLMSCLGLGFVRAQESAASPQQQRSDSAQPTVSAGREADQESREAREKRAEEEKDATAEFRQSASVKLLAKLTGLSLQQSYWLSVILNFAVIAAVIVWAGRKYLPGTFRDRTVAIQKAMQEAQKASEEARRKLAEIESRLRKLDVEIGMMRDAAEGEAAEEEARIQAAAEEDAHRIVASAEQEIAAAAKTARRQLTAHAADLAVGLARKQIRVDAATDQALVRNLAGQLGTASDHPGKDGR